MTKLYNLQGTKAVDKNGRLKSGFLGALRGFLSGGLGGAIYGGARGALQPQWDEELKKVAAVHDQQDKVDGALKINNQLAQLDHLDAESQAALWPRSQSIPEWLDHLDAESQALRAKNSPDALAARTHTQQLGEATRRLRLMGGKYTPGHDPTLDSLVSNLGLSPKQGGMGGFNPQNLKTVGRDLVYVENVGGQPTPLTIYSENMTPTDRDRNAIALAGVNAQRARNGEPPLMLSDEVLGSPASSSDAPATQPSTAPAPTQSPTQSQPATQPQPARPALVPQQGALTPSVPARPAWHKRLPVSSYRGRTSSGGPSKGDAIGASLEARDSARYTQEAANNRAQAAAATARGEDDVAARWEEAAKTADENAQKVGTRRGNSARPPAPRRGDPLGILD